MSLMPLESIPGLKIGAVEENIEVVLKFAREVYERPTSHFAEVHLYFWIEEILVRQGFKESLFGDLEVIEIPGTNDSIKIVEGGDPSNDWNPDVLVYTSTQEAAIGGLE